MTEHSSHIADVVVIGGGIIGCSIAWKLAQAGMKVTVLDRSAPGTEASSAAAGMLAPASELGESRVFADLCAASRSIYARFVAEVEEASGHTPGYRTDGTLLVALDHEQEEELAALHRKQSALGFDLSPLSAAEVHNEEAELSPGIRAGLFIPGDHWVDNERLMRALVVAGRHAGVRFEPNHPVHKFHTQGDNIKSVAAGNHACYTARTFVLAAGCWSGQLAGELRLQAPTIPCRGQMMEFEASRELPFVVRSGLQYLVPRPERRVLVGTTAEYAGFEKAVSAKGLHSILDGAMKFAPQLSGFRFLRAWSGLRPDTPDHLPILGYGEFNNLVFATGHFRNGILLAPVTAEIAVDLILRGSTLRPIEAYRPTRFAVGGGQQKAEVIRPHD